MKKTCIIILFTIFITLVACGDGTGGYPTSVTLNKTGDAMTIKGKKQILSLYLRDDEGGAYSDISDDRSDSCIVTYKWLTARAKKYDTRITLIAAPSDLPEKRSLYLQASWGQDAADIKVTQK